VNEKYDLGYNYFNKFPSQGRQNKRTCSMHGGDKKHMILVGKGGAKGSLDRP
jgi:hypothetical protein